MTRDQKIIQGMASYIDSLNIDEFICNKKNCEIKFYQLGHFEHSSCIDCIIDFFERDCKYLIDNVCVNEYSRYYKDSVDAKKCGACILKSLE